MKRAELLTAIPRALGELRAQGREMAYFDEISRQVLINDESYMQKRTKLRQTLGRVGINIAELPSGFLRPGPGRMYPALYELEEQGVIRGEFEGPREDGKLSRRMYGLIEQQTLDDFIIAHDSAPPEISD